MLVTSLELLEIAITLECDMYGPLTGPARLHSCGLYAAIVDKGDLDAGDGDPCGTVCGSGDTVEEAYEENRLLKLMAELGVCADRCAPCCCCCAALRVFVTEGGSTARRWTTGATCVPGAWPGRGRREFIPLVVASPAIIRPTLPMQSTETTHWGRMSDRG